MYTVGYSPKKVFFREPHTTFGKACSEEKNDQPIWPLWNVSGMFLWLKIAQNEILQLAILERNSGRTVPNSTNHYFEFKLTFP